jgi:hypothetical protein
MYEVKAGYSMKCICKAMVLTEPKAMGMQTFDLPESGHLKARWVKFRARKV